jgi:hypothetical protein
MISWFWQATLNSIRDSWEARAKRRFAAKMKGRLMLVAWHRDERNRLPRFKKGFIL